jgi:hypothetical protein
MSEKAVGETCEICHRFEIFDQLERCNSSKDGLSDINCYEWLTFRDGQKTQNTNTITMGTPNTVVNIPI